MARESASESDLVSRRNLLATGGALGALTIAGCISGGDSDGGDSGGDSDGGADGGSGGDGNGDGSSNGSDDQELSGTIDIAGSSTVFPLATAVAERFRSPDYEGHTDVEINISSTGSGGGFANHFCPGNTDFNNASRPMKDEEKSSCEDNGVEWVEMQVATDALTVVVNNDADFVDCLTVEELRQIWKPDAASTWDEVRDEFPNEEIVRFGAAETSGTFDYFTENVVGESGAHTGDYQATEQDNTIVQGVQGNEYGIGYFGFSYYYNNPDTVKAISIDDGDGCVEPSLANASEGEYTPLARPLFTYPAVGSLADDHVAEFARYFVEQTTNEDLVAGQVGYVPLTDAQQSDTMDELEAAIEEAQG